MSGGRRWLELSVRAGSDTEGSELLADALIERGTRGVVERSGWLVGYFEEPADPAAFVECVRDGLVERTGVSSLEVRFDWQDHEEWSETWKRGLGVRRVGSRIVVHPSWMPPGDVSPDDVVILLDPGMAFGTAEHGTTRGCLRLLEEQVRRGDRVIDIGAGSGILSIAAAELGATGVVAIEGDPLACEALRENLERNGVEDLVSVERSWTSSGDLSVRTAVDGVVANLETGLLIPLFPGLRSVVADDGWLIVSGILDHEWDRVACTVRAHGLRLVRVDEDGEWRSGLFRR